MPRRKIPRDGIRRAIAAEAARIIVDQGLEDFHLAKRKAVERLRLEPDTHLPPNRDVEHALRDVQDVYGGADRLTLLRRLRDGALEAMAQLKDFRPRLVGPVLEGTADRHSSIQLHVFAEFPEQFSWFLEERGIPYDRQERIIRMERNRGEQVPFYEFEAGGLPYVITCLPLKALRQPPLNPHSGRAMRRVSAHGLRELIAEAAEPALL
ncbi:MAG: hypothetical protein AAGE01_21915 [Pseudomonadota bacterium]